MANLKKKFQKTVTRTHITKTQENGSFLQKIQKDLENKQSLLSLVLGVLILIVVGVLIFNYFNRSAGEIGPSDQTSISNTQKVADVSKDNLPGKYTVKEGDSLFLIAQNYYGDGYQYTKIAETNKLADPNFIQTDQILDIPKLDLGSQNNPTSTTSATLNADLSDQKGLGTGGATNQTIWGETITENTYTVVKGDWLSTIAGRAYGDIYAFDKIAKANNIANPNEIEPGLSLKIPR